MKKVSFLLLCICISCFSFSQFVWEKTFDEQNSFEPTNGNSSSFSTGFVSTGHVPVGNFNRAAIFDVDRTGALVFQQLIGEDNFDFYSTDVISYDNESYIVVGYTDKAQFYLGNFQDSLCTDLDKYYNAFVSRIYVTKPHLNWVKVFGDSLRNDKAIAVEVTQNGEILITGYARGLKPVGKCPTNDSSLATLSGVSTELLVAKYSGTGNQIWINSFTDDLNEIGNHIQENSNGNYFITGAEYPSNQLTSNILVVEVDPAGNVVQSKSIQGSTNLAEGKTILEYDPNTLLLQGTNTNSAPANNMTLFFELNMSLGVNHAFNITKSTNTNNVGGRDMVINDTQIVISATSTNYLNTYPQVQSALMINPDTSLHGYHIVNNSITLYPFQEDYNDALIHFNSFDTLGTPIIGYHLFGNTGPTVSSQISTQNDLSTYCSFTDSIGWTPFIPNADTVTLNDTNLNELDSSFLEPADFSVVDSCTSFQLPPFGPGPQNTSSTNNLFANESIIYPNPSKGNTIFIQGDDIQSIQVFSINGKLVYHNFDKTSKIDITNWPSGTYFFRLQYKNKVSTTRVIVR